jgi:3-deoxy-manno-octulosonate cytidylyltransferase (CMP-KDO synthetase)
MRPNSQFHPNLPQADIEVCEALEQLRALWHGYRIALHVTEQTPGPGVDTPEDLERVRQFFLSAKSQLLHAIL